MARQDEDAAIIRRASPGGVGLLIIDMINALDFEGAERLVDPALAAANIVARLRDMAERACVPVIYVNDNYGHWHSDRSAIVEACGRADAPGRRIVERIAPRKGDYFVIKPQFSGFYATSLPVLLPKLGVNRLVLTGIAADICVLFTAADAHMREYDLWIPADAVASEDDQRKGWALDIMRKSMGAETRPTKDLDLGEWMRSAD
jgi:nicotinamidase-related amidase